MLTKSSQLHNAEYQQQRAYETNEEIEANKNSTSSKDMAGGVGYTQHKIAWHKLILWKFIVFAHTMRER